MQSYHLNERDLLHSPNSGAGACIAAREREREAETREGGATKEAPARATIAFTGIVMILLNIICVFTEILTHVQLRQLRWFIIN
jgi:hypothetical protein